MVPVVAILAASGSPHIGQEVGVGAILGAPMMLSTLTLFLVAVFAAAKRGWGGEFRPERSGLRARSHLVPGCVRAVGGGDLRTARQHAGARADRRSRWC
ncbi:MAG: hypothetical protein MZV65_13405 [Chromatiales bacterium]|nr:hypothetical protein [Chromatiales bacterium]